MNRCCWKYLGILIVLLLINIGQALIYTENSAYRISFSWEIYLFNAYFYFCIVSVLMIVSTLSKNDDRFSVNMDSLIRKLAYIFCVILYVFLLSPGTYDFLFSHNVLTNINDIVACIAAVYSLFLTDAIQKKDLNGIAFCMLSFVGIVIAGRKLALAGILLELLYVLISVAPRRITVTKILWGLIGFVMASIICVCNWEMIGKIYEYINTIILAGEYVIDGRIYEKINSSMAFRVSVIIYGIEEMANSMCLGIGIGNTAYLLREMMPMGNYMMKGDGAVSTHNFIIQLVLEWGYVALIFGLAWVRYVVKLLSIREKSKFHHVFICMSISVVIWGLAPSGFYTIYFVYIMFFYIIFKLRIDRSCMK